MKRAILFGAIAMLLGIGGGEYLTNDLLFRRWIGGVVRQDHLLALVNRDGIYQRDVNRIWQGQLFSIGADAAKIDSSTGEKQKRVLLEQLIVQEKLHALAARQTIARALVDREMNLLHWQFVEEPAWRTVLHRAATYRWQLRSEIAASLRDRAWIESRIAAQIAPNDEECRRYFETQQEAFQQPLRLRASHLFLAAPEGYPEDVIEAKRALIDELATRLQQGESFPALVAEFSEDETTKTRGGDLDYFCEKRMLPEIFAAAQLLREGETSGPIRSRLGFHLVRLTKKLPPRQLTFAEALPEISNILENQKRENAVATLAAGLPGKLKIAGQRNRSQFERTAYWTMAATAHGTF